MSLDLPINGQEIDDDSYTKWLYQEYVRPPIVDVASGARALTSDLLRGTVNITGNTIHVAGGATGYIAGKSIRGLSSLVYHAAKGVMNKPFKQ